MIRFTRNSLIIVLAALMLYGCPLLKESDGDRSNKNNQQNNGDGVQALSIPIGFTVSTVNAEEGIFDITIVDANNSAVTTPFQLRVQIFLFDNFQNGLPAINVVVQQVNGVAAANPVPAFLITDLANPPQGGDATTNVTVRLPLQAHPQFVELVTFPTEFEFTATIRLTRDAGNPALVTGEIVNNQVTFERIVGQTIIADQFTLTP